MSFRNFRRKFFGYLLQSYLHAYFLTATDALWISRYLCIFELNCCYINCVVIIIVSQSNTIYKYLKDKHIKTESHIPGVSSSESGSEDVLTSLSSSRSNVPDCCRYCLPCDIDISTVNSSRQLSWVSTSSVSSSVSRRDIRPQFTRHCRLSAELTAISTRHYKCVKTINISVNYSNHSLPL